MKIVSTRRKTNQQKRQLNQLNEILIDAVIGNNDNMGAAENENLEQQANGRHRDFERIVDDASQNRVIGNNTDDRIRDAVDSAVIVVQNPMQDVILTTMNDMVIPRVEMAVRLMTGSSGN